MGFIQYIVYEAVYGSYRTTLIENIANPGFVRFYSKSSRFVVQKSQSAASVISTMPVRSVSKPAMAISRTLIRPAE